MKTLLFLLGPIICLMAGCDSRSDPEKLQGEWRLHAMSGVFDFGLPPTKGMTMAITFSEDEFTYENLDFGIKKGLKHKVTGIFSCDSTKKPRQITFTFEGRTVIAIYEFSFGTLRICVGEEDDVSPSEFAGGAPWFRSSRPALLIFERSPNN